MKILAPPILIAMCSMPLTIASAQIASEDILPRTSGVLHYSVVEPSVQLWRQYCGIGFHNHAVLPSFRISNSDLSRWDKQ